MRPAYHREPMLQVETRDNFMATCSSWRLEGTHMKQRARLAGATCVADCGARTATGEAGERRFG
jgi:hypothetical protein